MKNTEQAEIDEESYTKEKRLAKKEDRLSRKQDINFIVKIFGIIFGFSLLLYVGEFVCSFQLCTFKSPPEVIDLLLPVVSLLLGYFLARK